MVMGWERCRRVPHGRQGAQNLWIMHSIWSSWVTALATPWCLLPFARRDHSRGHGEGDCGCSCGRLEWEAVRGQRVQILEELVWVSSTALFTTLSCRRGREGAVMLLCGAGRNVQPGGFETSWRRAWVFFQWLQTIHKDNRVELRLYEEFVCRS